VVAHDAAGLGDVLQLLGKVQQRRLRRVLWGKAVISFVPPG